jgi:uncharacterized protein (UPF0332 family)
MAFDWADFLNMAEELATRPEEHCLRTAISRSYYYAYHLARKRVIDNGFTIVRGGDTHKQVWEKFDASPDWNCKKLYQMAKRLKDKRQQADYDLVFPRLQDEVPEILLLTRRFAGDLSRLSPRLPANASSR